MLELGQEGCARGDRGCAERETLPPRGAGTCKGPVVSGVVMRLGD